VKKILHLNLLLTLFLFGEFDPHICATYMGSSVYDAKPKKNCVIDNNLERWIKCRAYYEKNMLNGLNYHGEAKVQGSPTYFYDLFDKEIKKVLKKEVESVINKSQTIMCVKNREDDLFKYQESIAEHEWCYAPKFLKAFNDDMNEHEMKYKYFYKLYETRSAMLESKEKPRKKSLLCGVYLDCMRSFINANHTEASGRLKLLYEKTKKECRSNYFVITTKLERKESSRKDRGKNVMIKGPKSLVSTWNITKVSKQIMQVDAKHNIIRIMALVGDAHSSKQGSSYKFNQASCSYEQESKSFKDKNLNYALAKLKSHNIGLVDDKEATIWLQVRATPVKKKFSIAWKSLKDSGSWSGHRSYHKREHRGDVDAPEGLEGLSGIGNVIKKTVTTMRQQVGPKSKEITQMGIDNFARSKKEACHNMRVHEGFFVDETKSFSIDVEIDIDIRDATNFEIGLMRDIADKNSIYSYRAQKIRVSKFENEPTTIFDSLQNSIYEDISSRDKKSWDSAEEDLKKEIQNKKDVEEFDGMSIDDLEMFSK